MKSPILILTAATLVCLMASCNGKGSANTTPNDADATTITGKYYTENPEDSTNQMGIDLQEKGVAASINMPTLPYKTWKQENDTTLVVYGTSKADDGNIEVADTFTLDASAGTIAQHGTDIVYRKK